MIQSDNAYFVIYIGDVVTIYDTPAASACATRSCAADCVVTATTQTKAKAPTCAADERSAT